MKYLTLFPTIDHLNFNAKFWTHYDKEMGKKVIDFKKEHKNWGDVDDDDAVFRLLIDFWSTFRDTLTDEGDIKHIPPNLDEDVIFANCVISSLYTFTELQNKNNYEPYLDVIKKSEESIKDEIYSRFLRTPIKAFECAFKNEYSSKTKENNTEGTEDKEKTNKKNYFFSNEYLDLRWESDDKDYSKMEIGGWDKVLAAQIILNNYIKQKRIGKNYKNNLNEHGEVKRLVNEADFKDLLTQVEIEKNVDSLVGTNINIPAERKRNVKNRLGKILEDLYTIDYDWSRSDDSKVDHILYEYEKELIFHSDSLLLMLDDISKEETPGQWSTNKRESLAFALVSAIANPMVLFHRHVLTQVLFTFHDGESIRDSFCRLASIMCEFCLLFFNVMDCDLELCEKCLRRVVELPFITGLFIKRDTVRSQGFTDFEFVNTKQVVERLVEQDKYTEKTLEYISTISLVGLMPRKVTTSKGVEDAFIHLNILLAHIDFQDILKKPAEFAGKKGGMKQYYGDPCFLIEQEPDEPCYNPVPFSCMLFKKKYGDKAEQLIFETIESQPFSLQEKQAKKVYKILKRSKSEEEFCMKILQLNTDSNND